MGAGGGMMGGYGGGAMSEGAYNGGHKNLNDIVYQKVNILITGIYRYLYLLMLSIRDKDNMEVCSTKGSQGMLKDSWQLKI